MFTTYTASKSQTKPDHKNTKASPELIEYLKNTTEIPKKNFKENQNSTLNHSAQVIKSDNQKVEPKQHDEDRSKARRPKVVEEDISKIANSYILEGNILKKKQAYQEAMKKEKKQPLQDKENTTQDKTLDRKEILKLEYLEKMGFLRNQEKQILADYRKSQPSYHQQPQNYTAKKVQTERVSTDISCGYGSLYSPKQFDQRQMSHLYPSNSKLLAPNHYY